MKGKITSGVGEGAAFLSMKEYRDSIYKATGFYPYPGTLNVECRVDLTGVEGIWINGFVKSRRRFGGLNVFPAKLNGMNVAIVVPEKRKHREIEIISSENLRKKYNLKDGDIIEFRFVPFIKKRRKYRLKCNDKGEINIFYEPPYKRNALFEKCMECDNGNKVLPQADVASYIFFGDYKKTYYTLMKWARKKYSIMSPAVLIEHERAKEWQVEVKLNPL